MDNVYIIWREDYPDDKGYGYDKSICKVFGSKQEAEEYLSYAEKELAWYTDEDGNQEPLSIYSLTEHEVE